MTAIIRQAPGRTRMSFPHAVKDTLVIARRNLLRNIRLPQLLFFATVQPVMFLLMFNFVFGGAIGGSLPAVAGGNYLNWLVPGLLIHVATIGSGQTALGLTEDLSKGVIERFRSLPMARSAVLAGRTVSDLIRNGFVITLMMTVGFLIGFRWQTSFLGLLGGMLVAMAFAFSLSWVMATIGLAVKNPEATQSAVFLPVFPLVFASSVFVPTQTMPDWLRLFAEHQPVTILANAVRGLMVTGDVGSYGWRALLWIAAILVVFFPLTVRQYRRVVG